MKFSLLAATIVVLSLIACNGPTTSSPGIGSENTPVETPEVAEPSPSTASLTTKAPENTPVGTPEVTEPPPASASPTPKSSENTFIETPEYTGVIFSKDGALEFGYRFDQASTSFWEPSSDDVSRAEECIRQFLVSLQDDSELGTYQKENVAFILENLKEYRRQYVGIVVDGEKRIWCNSFLVDYPVPHWKSRPVDVLDGGRWFWQIEYILLKDECVNFYIHGEA